MFAFNPKPVKFAETHLKDFEELVRPNLAYDVSHLEELRQKGIPISAPNMDQYYDGSPDVTFDLPLDRRRGVDLNDLYQAAETGKKKVSKTQLKLKSK